MNVFLTWELGTGLGHLIDLLPLVQGLPQRGHRVFAAMQDLSKAERVFGSGRTGTRIGT
jgi:hypothetical protein